MSQTLLYICIRRGFVVETNGTYWNRTQNVLSLLGSRIVVVTVGRKDKRVPSGASRCRREGLASHVVMRFS